MLQSIDYNLQIGNIPPNAPPEYQLWLAVIDRAILDYLKWKGKLDAKGKGYLRWFLFETESHPHNLTYLCDILFDQDNAARDIRARVIKMKQNLESKEGEVGYRGRYRRKFNRTR